MKKETPVFGQVEMAARMRDLDFPHHVIEDLVGVKVTPAVQPADDDPEPTEEVPEDVQEEEETLET